MECGVILNFIPGELLFSGASWLLKIPKKLPIVDDNFFVLCCYWYMMSAICLNIFWLSGT
jgi:hypothetical protein